MEPKLYLRFSDLFDREPVAGELVQLVDGIPMRHAIYALTSINQRLRVAMQGPPQEFGILQENLLAAHMDDECLAALKSRFAHVRVEERPVFLPECILNVIQAVISHGDPEPLPVIQEDQRIRCLIGRACLIVNNLLVNETQARALKAGTKNDQRIELMTQWLSSFEVANPPKADHLMPRFEIMYRMLLKDPQVRARIMKRAGNFDLEAQFETRLGVSLEHWLFIIFAIYAYLLNIGSALDPDPNFMVINPSIFRGKSDINQEDFLKVLETISTPLALLQSELASAAGTDLRYDFVALRSSPLLKLEENKLVPTDLSFLLEKCHTGVHWALHDVLPVKLRQSLFNAWGALFEEYVHWLLEGVRTHSVIYFFSPKWKKRANESFDGIILKEGVMLTIECKGGFIAKTARYSGDSATFISELDKKVVPGCKQLAEKIGAAFAERDEERRELEDVNCNPIRAVLPVLILQDHIIRVPFANWYLNVQFQKLIGEKQLRAGVVVRSLTVLMIDEVESIVHSAESERFDFVYAIHNRTVRDPDVLSGMLEWLAQYPDFGRKPSPRLAAVLEQVVERISSFLFP